MKTLNIVAIGILVLAIVVPSVLLGILVAPWFFLIMVLLAVVPLLLLRKPE